MTLCTYLFVLTVITNCYGQFLIEAENEIEKYPPFYGDDKYEKSATIKKAAAFNPDEFLNTPQIARRHGYPAESHVILTEDGYLLTVHRIPHGLNNSHGGQPVFLQHGLFSSSVDWVDVDRKSLAFILADSGYDVWMGNARGNKYSTAHAHISTDTAEYWDFSWHEMGTKDLPAVLEYVSKTTGQGGRIIYIGHSMGTSMFFVFSSTLPEVAKKYVKAMVALAPVAYMTHIESPIRYLTPFLSNMEWLRNHLGFNSFKPNSKIMKFLGYECELANLSKVICEDVIFILAGFDKDQFDMDHLPVVLAHVPAGTSTKAVIHYAQEIKHDGIFQQYDYGTDENKIKYGTELPPQYNLTQIQVPIYLMYGDNDWLASKIDVLRLANLLQNKIGVYEIPLKTFNHIDFIWGKDAPELVFQPMMKIMKRFG